MGVLLLNLGGPDKLEDVEPFLYNLFSDEDILRIKPPFNVFQPLLARLISTLRAPKSREGYSAIGGGSPLRKLTDEQARRRRNRVALCVENTDYSSLQPSPATYFRLFFYL